MDLIKKIMSGVGVVAVIAVLILIIVSNAKSKTSASIPKKVGDKAEVEETVKTKKPESEYI